MKKNAAKLFQRGALALAAAAISLAATSCDNWMKSDGFFEEIDEEVRVANATVITPYVRFADNSFGMTTPLGSTQQKVDVKFQVSATTGSEYAFVGWKAFSSNDFPTNKNHSGMFYFSDEDAAADTSSKVEKAYDKVYKPKEIPASEVEIVPDDGDGTTATVTIKRERSDVFLIPMVAQRPKIQLSVPQNGINDVVRNSPIRILFTKPMDKDSIIGEDGRLTDNIHIYQANGTMDNLSMEEITEWFTDIEMNEKGTMVTMRLYGGDDENKTNAKKMAANKAILVKLSASLKDSHGYAMGMDTEIRFTIGSQDDTLAPVIDKIRAGRGPSNETGTTSGRWGSNVTNSTYQTEAGAAYLPSDEMNIDNYDGKMSYIGDGTATNILEQRTGDKIHLWVYAQDINNSASSTPQEGDVSLIIVGGTRLIDGDGNPDGTDRLPESEHAYASGDNISSTNDYNALDSGRTGFQFTEDLSSIGDGLIRIDVAAEDTTGNNSNIAANVNSEKKNFSRSVFVVKDTTAPDAEANAAKLEAKAPTGDKSNDTGWFNSTNLSEVKFSKKDGETIADKGHAKLSAKESEITMALRLTSSTAWPSSAPESEWENVATSAGAAVPYTIPTPTGIADGDVNVTCAFKDDLGNISAAAALPPLKYDSVKPVLGKPKFKAIDGATEGLSQHTKLERHALEVPLTEALSGLYSLEVEINAPDGESPSAAPFGETDMTISLDGTAFAEGTDYTIDGNKILFTFERGEAGNCRTGTLRIENLRLCDENENVNGDFTVKLRAVDLAQNESALSEAAIIAVDTDTPIVSKICVATVENFPKEGAEDIWLSGAHGNEGIADLTVTIEEPVGIKLMEFNGDVDISAATLWKGSEQIPAGEYTISGSTITFTKAPADGTPVIRGAPRIDVTLKGVVFTNRTSSQNYENALTVIVTDFADNVSRDTEEASDIYGTDKDGGSLHPGAKLKVDEEEPAWKDTIEKAEYKVTGKYLITADRDANTLKVVVAGTGADYLAAKGANAPFTINIKETDAAGDARDLLTEWFTDDAGGQQGSGLAGVSFAQSGVYGEPSSILPIPYELYSHWSEDGAHPSERQIYIKDNTRNGKSVTLSASIDNTAPEMEISIGNGGQNLYWKLADGEAGVRAEGAPLPFTATKTGGTQTIKSDGKDGGDRGKTAENPLVIYTNQADVPISVSTGAGELAKITINGTTTEDTASAGDTITATAGGIAFTISATDDAGNENAVHVKLILDEAAADSAKPTVKIKEGSAQKINTVSGTNYFGKHATATIEQEDLGSGLATKFAAQTTATPPAEETEEVAVHSAKEETAVNADWLKGRLGGTEIVAAGIKDNVGNESDAASATLALGGVSAWAYDETPPELDAGAASTGLVSDITKTADAPEKPASPIEAEIWDGKVEIEVDAVSHTITLKPSRNVASFKLNLSATDADSGILGWVEADTTADFYSADKFDGTTAGFHQAAAGGTAVTFTKSSAEGEIWAAETKKFHPVDYAGNAGDALTIVIAELPKPTFSLDFVGAFADDTQAYFNHDTTITLTTSDPLTEFNATGGSSSLKNGPLTGGSPYSIEISPSSGEDVLEGLAAMALYMYATDGKQISDGIKLTYGGKDVWKYDKTPPAITTFTMTDGSATGDMYSTYDAAAKTATAGSGAGTLKFTFSATENGSGEAGYHVTQTPVADPTALAATDFTTSPTLSGYTTGTIYVYARDNVGNVSTSAYEITLAVDSTAPAKPTVTISAPLNGNGAYAVGDAVSFATTHGGEAVSFSLTAESSDASGIRKIYYTVGSGTEKNEGAISTDSATFTIPASDLGPGATLKFYAEDKAGNTSEAQTLTFTLDETVSDVTGATVTGTNIFHREGTTTYFIKGGTSATVTPAAIADDDVAGYILAFGDLEINPTTPGNYLINAPSAETRYTLYAKDKVGNVSANGYEITLTPDSTEPTATPTLDESTAKASLHLFKEGSTVSVTADDDGSGIAAYSFGTDTAYTTTDDGSVPESFPLVAGANHLWVKDKVGNEKKIDLGTWTKYDAGAPTYTYTAPTGDATTGTLTISVPTTSAITSVSLEGYTTTAATTFEPPKTNSITLSVTDQTEATTKKVKVTDVFGGTTEATLNPSGNIFSRMLGGIAGFFGLNDRTGTRTAAARQSRQVDAATAFSEEASRRVRRTAEAAGNAAASRTDAAVAAESTSGNALALAGESEAAAGIARSLAERAEAARLALAPSAGAKTAMGTSAGNAENGTGGASATSETPAPTAEAGQPARETSETASADDDNAAVKTAEKPEGGADTALRTQLAKIGVAVAAATAIVGGGALVLRTARRRRRKSPDAAGDGKNPRGN